MVRLSDGMPDLSILPGTHLTNHTCIPHFDLGRNRPRILVALSLALLAAPWASGGTIVFGTPSGASDPGGNPMRATAVFQATSGTQLLITLENNQANPRDDGQMLVSFSFRISQSLPDVSMSSSAASIEID